MTKHLKKLRLTPFDKCLPPLRVGFKFSLASLALIVIGVGSFAFHGTLLRSAQMLDEIPMLWGSLSFLWIAISLNYPPGAVRPDPSRFGSV
jgi:dihydroceramidase